MIDTEIKQCVRSIQMSIKEARAFFREADEQSVLAGMKRLVEANETCQEILELLSKERLVVPVPESGGLIENGDIDPPKTLCEIFKEYRCGKAVKEP